MKNKSFLKLLILISLFTSTFVSGCANFNDGISNNYKNPASKINEKINEVGEEFSFDTDKFINKLKYSGYNISNYLVEDSLRGAAIATSYSIDNDKVYVYQYNNRNSLYDEILNISQLKKLGLEDEMSNIAHYYKQGRLLIRYEGSTIENLEYFNKNFKILFV